MEEIDNHIGRGGSLVDFAYYNDCLNIGNFTGNGSLTIVDVHEYREDEKVYTDWEPAKRMCAVHANRDPMREVRISTHQLMQEIHELRRL